MRADALMKAVEGSDLDATLAQLSPTVVFHSPVVPDPLHGTAAMAKLFDLLFRTFHGFRYVAGYTSDDGGEVLRFRWRTTAGEEVEGIDLLAFDEAGLIVDFTVMVRPLAAVIALRDAVWEQLTPGQA